MSEAHERLKQTRENLTKSEQTILQLKTSLDKSEDDLKKLKIKAATRSIAPDAREKMVTALLYLKEQNVKINCLLGGAEGCNYARQLRDIFSASGWKVESISQVLYTRAIFNIEIHFGGEEPPLATIYVANLFASLGLYADSLYRDKNRSKGTLELYVGSKG
jgi:hypothetical protein